jgi:hypothetical protein
MTRSLLDDVNEVMADEADVANEAVVVNVLVVALYVNVELSTRCALFPVVPSTNVT